MSIGPVVTARAVRRGMQDLLQTWVPSVLAELARREGLDVVKTRTPRTWTRMQDFRRLTIDQSPAVVVTSPGIAAPPHRESDGLYQARWALAVYTWVRGASYEETADLVGLYAAAVRIAGVQHRIDVDGAKRARWVGERYAEVPNDESRTLGAGAVAFELDIADAVSDFGGPGSPPVPPYVDPEDPDVSSGIVTLDQL